MHDKNNDCFFKELSKKNQIDKFNLPSQINSNSLEFQEFENDSISSNDFNNTKINDFWKSLESKIINKEITEADIYEMFKKYNYQSLLTLKEFRNRKNDYNLFINSINFNTKLLEVVQKLDICEQCSLFSLKDVNPSDKLKMLLDKCEDSLKKSNDIFDEDCISEVVSIEEEDQKTINNNSLNILSSKPDLLLKNNKDESTQAFSFLQNNKAIFPHKDFQNNENLSFNFNNEK